MTARLVAVVTVGALIAGALLGCRGAAPVFTTRFLAFGTLVDLSIVGVDRAQAERASELIEKDFAFMHRAWHAWEPGPLGRVNELIREEHEFAAPPSILPLIRRSQEYAEQAGDLFNPAIGRLVSLWGFHTDAPECRPPPDPGRIARLVAADPRMRDLHLDGLRLRSDNPAVKLDFGAIAKGYGIELAAERLRELGVSNAILNAGGDVRALGDRSGRPWRVAVRRPSGGVLGVVMLSGDESLFTSGDYDRNFIYEGRTYHHIIDPRTGYPVEDTRSVTVAHRDAVTADAAATALFVAGPSGWREVARRMGVSQVLLVDSEGTVHMTPEMAERFEFIDDDVDFEISPRPKSAEPRERG